MIGENYPEKELLKNDRGLTPCGDNVVVVVPVLTACPPPKGMRGARRVGAGASHSRGAPAYFSSLPHGRRFMGSKGQKD